VRGQLKSAHDGVAHPKTLLVEHGEGVVLILSANVEQLLVAAVEEKASLVQIGREQSVSALQPQFVSEEGIGVEVSGAKKNGVDVRAASILEVNRVTVDAGQKRSLLNVAGPVVSHGPGPPGADDVFGAIFDALKGDVLGRIGGADEKKRLASELVRIAEIVSVHHATGELFNAGEGGDMRGGIVTRSNNNVGEALSGQHSIILEILDNDGEVVGFFVVDDRFHGMGKFYESSDVVLCPTSFLVVEKNLSWWEAGDGFAVVLLESVVGEFVEILEVTV